jgi:hypothetical protein
MNAQWKKLALCGVAALITLPNLAHAELQGDHYYFFRGIADLNKAQTLLQGTKSGATTSPQAQAALVPIESALNDFRKSCLPIDDRAVSPDVRSTARGFASTGSREQAALGLLRQARLEISREERDPLTEGPQYRAIRHIDEATKALAGAETKS